VPVLHKLNHVCFVETMLADCVHVVLFLYIDSSQDYWRAVRVNDAIALNMQQFNTGSGLLHGDSPSRLH
jgi:hypothetical protein